MNPIQVLRYNCIGSHGAGPEPAEDGFLGLLRPFVRVSRERFAEITIAAMQLSTTEHDRAVREEGIYQLVGTGEAMFTLLFSHDAKLRMTGKMSGDDIENCSRILRCLLRYSQAIANANRTLDDRVIDIREIFMYEFPEAHLP